MSFSANYLVEAHVATFEGGVGELIGLVEEVFFVEGVICDLRNTSESDDCFWYEVIAKELRLDVVFLA